MAKKAAANELPYTLVLGAGASISSGVAGWASICERLCDELRVPIPAGADPIAVARDEILSGNVASQERYLALRSILSGHTPSIGYKHLAQLVTDGYFNVILTTNWDSLLELSLARLLEPTDYKVLIRGELDDDKIADYLELPSPRIKVVKLHGDLISRILLLRREETLKFSSALSERLTYLFEHDVVVVGHALNDQDLLQPLLSRRPQRGSLLYVTPSAPKVPGAALLAGNPTTKTITGDLGKFDRFFVALNMTVQTMRTESLRNRKIEIEKKILEKEERGRGYFTYGLISEMVKDFTRDVLKLKPDLLLFINDPTAPGGMELKKRMQPLIGDVKHGVIEIGGEGKNRVFKRRVRTAAAADTSADYKKILILDSITFSGNTLRIAIAKAREWYPHADIRAGVLLISQHLLDQVLGTEDPLATIVRHTVTDRYEIFFPWGVTQTTGNFERRFEGLAGTRQVSIRKRPWGTIEILADEETCSVRLLTIEADEKLSFQRHLCRDELFVALDDNIGLDVCADELEKPADPFDSKIKSLILEKGDYILVPRGIWHRTKASKERVRLLEVGYGTYDQNNDIERRIDAFGRLDVDGSV